MLHIAWASTAQPTIHTASAAPAPAPVDLETLFADWQAAQDKQGFMARLDLATCQQLTDHICCVIPRRYPAKKKVGAQ